MPRIPSWLLPPLALAAPLFAWASEGIWGLAPCLLCLWQRAPYWVAAVLALLALAVPRWRQMLLLAAGFAVLGSAVVAAFHLGVEAGLWPSPLAGCQPPAMHAGASVEEMMAALPRHVAKSCDAATYLVPGLPVSMAAMNLLYALALGAVFISHGRPRNARHPQDSCSLD